MKRSVKFETTWIEAKQVARLAYKETGIPHEVTAMQDGRLCIAPKRWERGMSKAELAERSPEFCSFEQYGEKAAWESDAYLVGREFDAQARLDAEDRAENAKAPRQKVAREFVTSDRKEALSMARTHKGAVKNHAEGYVVTWSEWVG